MSLDSIDQKVTILEDKTARIEADIKTLLDGMRKIYTQLKEIQEKPSGSNPTLSIDQISADYIIEKIKDPTRGYGKKPVFQYDLVTKYGQPLADPYNPATINLEKLKSKVIGTTLPSYIQENSATKTPKAQTAQPSPMSYETGKQVFQRIPKEPYEHSIYRPDPVYKPPSPIDLDNIMSVDRIIRETPKTPRNTKDEITMKYFKEKHSPEVQISDQPPTPKPDYDEFQPVIDVKYEHSPRFPFPDDVTENMGIILYRTFSGILYKIKKTLLTDKDALLLFTPTLELVNRLPGVERVPSEYDINNPKEGLIRLLEDAYENGNTLYCPPDIGIDILIRLSHLYYGLIESFPPGGRKRWDITKWK